MLVPLAYKLKDFHMGYNLYNVGFTCGIVGTLFMSLFRAFGLESESLSLIAQGNNKVFTIYFVIIFLSMIGLGFIFNEKSFKGYKELLESSGLAPNDFVQINGFGISLMNMGIMGLIMLFIYYWSVET